MYVLIPTSLGGERSSEPPYARTPLDEIPDDRWGNIWLKMNRRPYSGVRLEFDSEEARILEQAGLFNRLIGGKKPNTEHLITILTETFTQEADGPSKNVTFVRLTGKFDQTSGPTTPDDTVLGTVFPHALTDHFKPLFTKLVNSGRATVPKALLNSVNQ
ncbi:MAG: hypothetical protein Q8L37_05900 [Candidatus Gottesmanbacteria bacterium]|nr:hypothetical protein [Candidatus Gottesmanbacteria bacterium]